jgi:membrane-bound serine protease (ClpP class)
MNQFVNQKLGISFFLFIILLMSLIPQEICAQDAAQNLDHASRDGTFGDGASGDAWIIPIKGDIEPSLSVFVRREVNKAVSEGADFIIFEIDTFGGRVDSALQITSVIMSIKDARTIAWVANSDESMGVSWSAGALIALSCEDIYMANGTSMGAAAPVQMSPGGSIPTDEKTVSAVRTQMAAIAEKNGHPVGIALAMVDQDVELWEIELNGETQTASLADVERFEHDDNLAVERMGIISPAGKLLSLTAGEAYRFSLSKGIIDDKDTLLARIGASEISEESSLSFADTLVSFLTSGAVQAILIIIGIVMIFFEINTPGFGIPGVAAIAAFAVVFGTNAMLGNVGSLEMILFLIGIILLVVEIFILPGFGVAGISGLILIGFSLIFSMQDFIIPNSEWEWLLMGRNAVVVSIGMILAVAGIAVIALLGPKIKLFDPLTLKTAITGTAGGPDPDSASGANTVNLPLEDEENFQLLVGKSGSAETTLRPAGKALIEGTIYSVESDGEFIEQGKPITVVRVRGNRILVRSWVNS